MMLLNGLQSLYAATIDRAKFREIASRVLLFILPLFYWGQPRHWMGIAIVLFGVFVRGWGAGHLRKDQRMAYGGPYLLVRHPLYTGSCLLALGLVVTLSHWVATILVAGLIIPTYWHTIRHEEQNLLARFGKPYEKYFKQTAPVWPTFSAMRNFFVALFAKDKSAYTQFSWSLCMKNKEYEVWLGVIAVFALLWFGAPHS